MTPYKRGKIDIARAVRVSDMRDYLTRRGYVEKPVSNPRMLYYESPRRADDGAPICYYLPAGEKYVDYPLRVRDFVRSFATYEGHPEDDVWKELLGVWPWDWMSAAVKAAEGSREPAA